MRTVIGLCLALLLAVPPLKAGEIEDLGRDFWNWRSVTQPFTYDDIPRIERPRGWQADWSAAAIAKRRQDLATFEQRWKKIPVQSDRSKEVDRRLLGSAIMRVHWEMDVLRRQERDPHFYNEQTLGALAEGLLPPPPFTPERSQEIVRRLESFPRILEDARHNLTAPVAPFARISIAELAQVRSQLQAMDRELKPLLAPESAARMDAATEQAIRALESYSGWLQERLARMPEKAEIGRDNYVWFLKNVALLPFTPEEMLEIGRHEWARSVAFEEYERHRNRDVPELKLLASQADQIKREAADEIAVRRALHERGILDVPETVQHYRYLAIPAYLAPLTGFSEGDDLTSVSRLGENGSRYIPQPSPDLSYFARAAAKDPRLAIAHEGVHYMQLAWSWSHEDPIRRHYYDSGANEGLAFYNEEMVTQAGLFDDSPHTREIIYNMARLRALRVEVDIKLATGQFSIAQGAEYLKTMVPMDEPTARAEAAFFATNPGQAITYQIGKTQILEFLAEARRKEGDRFDLARFHDFVWKNGNVPIALQKFEYLGTGKDLDKVEHLH